MTRMTRTCVAAVLVALAVAGCSNAAPKAAGQPAATASPVAAAPAPSETPPITREAAAKQYLAIVTPFNEVLDRLNKQCLADRKFLLEGGSSDRGISEILANARRCDAEVAKARRAFSAQLRATTWPAEVRGDIEALARLGDAEAYALEQAAKARTTQEWLDAPAPKDDGSADIVRARLGLPTRTK